jgi:hypothetical protein
MDQLLLLSVSLLFPKDSRFTLTSRDVATAKGIDDVRPIVCQCPMIKIGEAMLNRACADKAIYQGVYVVIDSLLIIRNKRRRCNNRPYS